MNFTLICHSSYASTQRLERYTIGDQEINYHSMVVGGSLSGSAHSGVYRGDSWICHAAIHAGIFQDQHGGCAVLERQGEQRNFASSIRNGISSISFNAAFPLSFSLSATPNLCGDPRRIRLISTCF